MFRHGQAPQDRTGNPYRPRQAGAAQASYFVRVAPHIALGYRRNQSGFGTWSVRFADGSPSGWLKKFGTADDLEPADDKHVFNYDQAIRQARKLARGEAETEATATGFAPITVDGALDAYERDLETRGGSVYNARYPHSHLPGALLSKPVALLDSKELRQWRDGLTAKGLKPSSVVRYCKALRAALNMAAAHDQRITNKAAWRVGLQSLPDATVARNVILDDATVSRIVNASYARDQKLGLLVDTLAVTGSRPSQATRLLVEDLHGGAKPRLSMPRSGKGGGKNRTGRMQERISIPITVQLAQKLKQAAKGRAADAPLLLQIDGQPWSDRPSDDYREAMREIVKGLRLDPDTVTLYALRHSSIVRQLLASVPIRVIAATHDTSVAMIEKHYSKFITDHTDDISRAALLHHTEPVADNVVAMVR
jgi:integrase